MMNFFLMLVFFFTVRSSTSLPGDHHEVRFQVEARNMGEHDTLFITGNHPKIGNWHPGKFSMTRIDSQTWEYVVSFTADTVIEYKFTLGDWGRESLDSMGRVMQNFKLKVQGDTLVRHVINRWKGGEDVAPTGGITGSVHYHDLETDGLLPRKLIVWLPPGYDSEDMHYPVLYMLDGQNLFDPATSFLGIDWQIDETADRLISEGLIMPLIIVGIYNTADRSDEYHDTPKGKLFRNAVIHQVKPLIDSLYRTQTDPRHTIIGGSSSGGLGSFILAWENPDVFSTAICISPAFKINNIDYVSQVKGYEGDLKPLRFYIEIGGDDLERKLTPGVDEMVELLLQHGYREGENLFYYRYPDGGHNERSWGDHMNRILVTLFSNE